jgi:hypothetical protein
MIFPSTHIMCFEQLLPLLPPFQIILIIFIILFSYMCVKYFIHIHPLLLSFILSLVPTSKQSPLTHHFTLESFFLGLGSTYKRENMIFVCHVSQYVFLNIIIFTSVQFPTNYIISFFFMAESASYVCIYIYIFTFSMVSGFKLRALCLLGRQSILHEPYPITHNFYINPLVDGHLGGSIVVYFKWCCNKHGRAGVCIQC